jgi:hypothetical protein
MAADLVIFDRKPDPGCGFIHPLAFLEGMSYVIVNAVR